MAIIVLTTIVRAVFLPLTVKTVLSQRALNKVNPQIKEIKEKHKNDKTAQSAAILKLYKDNNVNPVAGCLPLLIQLPILIALYKVFVDGFKQENLNLLYGFVTNPGMIKETFIGLINITQPNVFLTLTAGALQFLQAKQMASINKNQDGISKEMAALNSQMLYFFPILIIIIGWNLPAGLMLYWITTTGLSMAEQSYIKFKYK